MIHADARLDVQTRKGNTWQNSDWVKITTLVKRAALPRDKQAARDFTRANGIRIEHMQANDRMISLSIIPFRGVASSGRA